MEKAFLDALVGHAYPSDPRPRPIPDPHGDLYALDREQIAAYGAFRRKLTRVQNNMPTTKAQARLDHAGNTSIPKEFESFCFVLAMGMAYAGSTPQSWARYAVNALSAEENQAALRFLDRMVDRNYDAAELERLWDGLVRNLGLVVEGDLHRFFVGIRGEMAKLIRATHIRRHSGR